MTSDQIRNAALDGPWEAILSDHGDIVTIDNIRADYSEEDLDDLCISIVRRSAAPTSTTDGYRSMPGSYVTADQISEWEDFEEYDEVETRWVQAVAMVDGLNAASRS